MEETLTELMMWLKWAMLLPLTIGLIRLKHLNLAQKLVVVLAIVSVLTEFLAEYMADQYSNNLGVYHFFTLFEYVLLVLTFHFGYENFLPRKVIYTLLLVFVLIIGVEMWETKLKEFNSFSTTLEGIILIGIALWFFISSLQRLDIPQLSQHPIFWVASGTMLYFTANFLLFAYQEILIKIYQESEAGAIDYFEIWVIHGILNLVLYLFYARSLLCQWKESK